MHSRRLDERAIGLIATEVGNGRKVETLSPEVQDWAGERGRGSWGDG